MLRVGEGKRVGGDEAQFEEEYEECEEGFDSREVGMGSHAEEDTYMISSCESVCVGELNLPSYTLIPRSIHPT